MRPRLIRLADGVQREIVLDSTHITIGRDATNDICVTDRSVSSVHCRIEKQNGGFFIVDCQSMNGTYVNGGITERARLQTGDEIRIGLVIFYFITDDADVTVPRLRVDDLERRTLLSTDTVELSPADSSYLKAFVTGDLSTLQRLSHDMGVLVGLSAEINEVDDSERIQHRLLERIFEIAPAETGVILLGSDIDGMLSGSPVSRRALRSEEQVPVSRTILQQTLDSGKSLLRNDLLTESSSIAASRVCSVLCVPLSVKNLKTGVIYLATTNPTTRFDERHLELVTAIGGIAALALEHARYVEWLEVENRQLAHVVSTGHNMVGQSPKILKVYEAISLLAPTDSPVLILGESGTGKELAARAIHEGSSRRNGPFVVINCGAISDTLFTSELFGHVKGAFTGADRDKRGLIEEAEGGTLFLDELAELPIHCQAALLRVLETREVQRVGSTRSVKVDVRLISATNRSLADEIRTGGFRADLYYRMGLPLEIPPLRDRAEDIPPLERHFLQKFRSYTQRQLGLTPPDTIRVLQQYDWPGNVREFASAIQWAVVFGKSDRIRPEDLPPSVLRKDARTSEPVSRLDEALESFERQFIIRALEETRGNVVEAAALLVRAPNYLQRRISKLGLRSELDRIRGA